MDKETIREQEKGSGNYGMPEDGFFTDTGGGQPENKRGGFRKGILYGIAGTLLLCWTGINVFCRLTGTQILVTNRESSAVSAQSDVSLLDEKTVQKINELTAYADLYYYDGLDKEKLQNGLCEGLISGLDDKYSVYYNQDDYEQMQISTTGKYYGIGLGLQQDKDTMVVSATKVYEGTPSEQAGLKAEDIVVSVDGTDAASMELTELVKMIRGEEGTSVHLEVYRPSSDEYLSFDVERANVTLPSVSSKMMEGGIGYIHISSFETDTAKQFETELADLQAQGMEALILDIRYNGGGLVPAVVQILDDILPEGVVVYTEDKNGKREEYTSDGSTYLDFPLAVLINESSASASEILAGAVKDFDYGTLIGTTTYGKGIVQTIFPLEDGDAVKLTTAKYFTPKGNYIHGAGIEPDIELKYEYLNPEGEEYEEQYDNQIIKAIEVLQGELGE